MIKPENQKFYKQEWKKIRQKLIHQVGKCEICSKSLKELKEQGVWLTVHHKDRNPQNNERKNLLVCCPRCHFKQERLINIGYFNPKQLEFHKM